MRFITRRFVAPLLALLVLGCGESPATPPDAPPVASGRLIVEVSGLPRNGAIAAQADTLRQAGFSVRLRGPNGVDTVLLASTTFGSLRAGSYQLEATGATLDSVTYAPAVGTVTVTLAENGTAVASVLFGATTGGVDVRASGVPDGGPPVIALLQRPDGARDTLQLPARRLLLPPGSYVLTAADMEAAGALYSPELPADTFEVAAGAAALRIVAFRSQLASITLDVNGVPTADRLGFVTLVSPDGGERTVRADGDSLVFDNLLAGVYRRRAASFDVPRARYSPRRLEDTLVVAAGAAVRAPLDYDRVTASLRVQAQGVPAPLAASLRVTGAGGFDTTITSSALFTELIPGSYTIGGAPLTGNLGDGARTVRATPATRTADVAFGDTASAMLSYAITTGGLAVRVSGLPDSIAAQVQVTSGAAAGVSGFPWAVSAIDVRHDIPPGSYTVSAAAIPSGGALFVPSPVQRTVTVHAGVATDSVAVHYTETVGPTLDFAIAAAYVTQSAQRLDGTVPLIAGRDALLRVFVQANEGNSDRLTVRVRLLQDTVVYRTYTIPGPAASAPLSLSEGTLAQSWNVPIQGGDVREGMRFIADFGDAPGVSDANPANNRWPGTGAVDVDVRTAPPFALMLVPVANTADMLTGDVNAGNAADFTTLTRDLMPLEQVSVSVHAPFSSSAPALVADDGNNGWSITLGEMETLRLLESAGNTHYMGIVGTTYGNGIAGIASIRGRNAVSWDRMPGAPRIVAHELGHNFGRFHSPGCGAQFIDANYPHPGGGIGVWGWYGGTLLSPTTNDIMGYCNTQWISDYTWTGVLNYRSVNGRVLEGFRTNAPDSVLVVWGAVYGDSAVLEPAVRAIAVPEWPAVGRGDYTLDLLDARGAVLQSVRFDGALVDHRAGVRTFAFSLPVRSAERAPLTNAVTMRLRRGALVLAEQRARSAGAAPAGAAPAGAAPAGAAPAGAASAGSPRLRRRSTFEAALDWDSDTWPLAVVRDAESGQVLAIRKRPGEALRVGAGRAVLVTFSDGVRSVTRRLTAP